MTLALLKLKHRLAALGARRPLTDWFDGSVAPVRVGVYLRRTDLGIFYSYWDGSHWCRNARLSKGPAQAFKNAVELGRSSRETLAWCGLSGEPK